MSVNEWPVRAHLHIPLQFCWMTIGNGSKSFDIFCFYLNEYAEEDAWASDDSGLLKNKLVEFYLISQDSQHLLKGQYVTPSSKATIMMLVYDGAIIASFFFSSSRIIEDFDLGLGFLFSQCKGLTTGLCREVMGYIYIYRMTKVLNIVNHALIKRLMM
jgi:hypothetical protein